MIPDFDPATGALPPGDHLATLEEVRLRLGFTPRRRWLIQGLEAAVWAFRAAGIEQIYIDGSFCTEKPDPGDIDGYWVEPGDDVYDRLDSYWIDFAPVFVRETGAWKSKMWVECGVEFFIHLVMHATPTEGFPAFFRQDRDGQPRGIVRIVEGNDDQE